jgi:MFS family permease
MEQRIFSLPRNISSEFRRLLISSFTGNLASPIYALFVPLLASRLGASLFEIGIVGGASNAVYAFLPFIMGHFSDRRGARRFFILISFLVLTVVSVLYTVISSPVYLIFARIFEGVGWATLWPAMDAAVSRDVNPTDARKAFSIYNATWSGAAALGPLLGSALIFLTSIRDAFLLTVFLMGATLVFNLVPYLKHEDQNGSYPQTFQSNRTESHPVADVEPLSVVKAPAGVAFYSAALALAAVSWGVLYTFFAPYARSLGISILLIGVITFAFGSGRFFFYVLSINEQVRHTVLRRDKRVRNMLLALMMSSVTSLLISLRDPSGMAYLVAYAVVGMGASIVMAIAQVGIIAESNTGKYGRSAGIFESAIGIGACMGPIIGGAISGTSLAVPFLVPPIGFVIFLAALPVLNRRQAPHWIWKKNSA